MGKLCKKEPTGRGWEYPEGGPRYPEYATPEKTKRYQLPKENIAVHGMCGAVSVSDFRGEYKEKEPDAVINAGDWSDSFESVFAKNQHLSVDELRKASMKRTGELRDTYNVKPGDTVEVTAPQYAVPVKQKSPNDNDGREAFSPSSSFETAIIFDKTESVVGNLVGFTVSTALPDKYTSDENQPVAVVCAILEQPSIITDSGEQVDGELGDVAFVPVSLSSNGDKMNDYADSEFVLPLPPSDDFALAT